MQVTSFANGQVEIKMTEDEARKLLYVAQDVQDTYLEVQEDTSEDPEVSAHAGLVADMLGELQVAMEGAGLVD